VSPQPFPLVQPVGCPRAGNGATACRFKARNGFPSSRVLLPFLPCPSFFFYSPPFWRGWPFDVLVQHVFNRASGLVSRVSYLGSFHRSADRTFTLFCRPPSVHPQVSSMPFMADTSPFVTIFYLGLPRRLSLPDSFFPSFIPFSDVPPHSLRRLFLEGWDVEGRVLLFECS